MENQEADDLTSLEYKSFDNSKRLEVDLNKLKFGVLNDLFNAGDKYVEDLAALKEQAKREEASMRAPKKVKRLAGESVRDRDLW